MRLYSVLHAFYSLPTMLDFIAILVGALDSLPKIARTMLSAAAFAGLLCYIARRLPEDHIAAGVTFRKATVLVLILTPVTLHTLLDWRLVLVVDVLPGIPSAPNLFWWAAAAVWSAGAAWHLRNFLGAHLDLRRTYEQLEAPGEDLDRRMDHWRRRLRIRTSVQIGFGNTERPLSFGFLRGKIVLPNAARHWPLAVQDVLLLNALAHFKRRNWLWLTTGQVIAALYWPIPGVKSLIAGFNSAFEHTSDSLAAACFRDRIGYERGLKHAAERLTPAAEGLRQPTHFGWGDSGPLNERQRYLDSKNPDPRYDKVFWSVLPAILAMVLLTGITLEEFEEIPNHYVVLSEDWQSSYRSELEPVEVSRKRRWVVVSDPRKRYYVPPAAEIEPGAGDGSTAR